ncbi:MAG: DNA gyrase inhibitor YacG [Pirellulales bacterium]
MPVLLCPVCDQPINPQTSPPLPFCCDRCRQIDLGRWLDERYGLPYERPFDAEDAEERLPEKD